jgi:hypothetical protein
LFILTVRGSYARPKPLDKDVSFTKVAAKETASADKPTVTMRDRSSTDDPGFERYRDLLKRNPFSPRLPRPPAAAPAKPASTLLDDFFPVLPPVTPVEVKQPVAPPPAPTPPPPDPMGDWTYTGTVAIGDQVYAVVESKSSKSGQYLKVGDNLQGGTIQHIAQDQITLTLNGQPRTLAKSSAFNITPLNAAAAPGAPAPGQPGAPGQPPPGMPGGPPGMPGAPPGMPGAPGMMPGVMPGGAPGAMRVAPRR